jgi:hypothetical protein
MRHDLIQIAKNFMFNPDQFINFALKNTSVYGIIEENGMVKTSTLFSDKLVSDFQNRRGILQPEDVEGLSYCGWSSSIDPWMGTVEWTNPKTTTVIYATPNWENDDNQTPFAVIKNDGDTYSQIITLTSFEKDTVDIQKQIYLETLKVVIESL